MRFANKMRNDKQVITLHQNVIIFMFDSYSCNKSRAEYGYVECKAFDAAAFIGKWGEIYSVARSIVNAKIKQCKYRSEKSDFINIATSNQI